MDETLNVRIATAQGAIPLVISREALEDHFGAGAGAYSLIDAFKKHEDVITARALARMVEGETYSRENPLKLGTGDF
ncbi:hypothetical protein OOZ63_22480 [Paucibacter sp. PLA-PC-4]|uniref:DUF1488 family protein n=1 Tax=Paucibacter sp. PLA-PC-4 TaxID=2993655 RepID=UPI00224B1950|nr:DUF1488 family protein [Paucibacter sp. PLA-PC-4]MCX2864602.1 hypothetical protein [Paucibacter sp. PLA-PC-4]